MLAGLPDPQAPAPGPAAVSTELRVFDRAVEVTSSTRAILTPSGARKGEPLEVRLPLLSLAPGVYDVEVRRSDARGVVQIAHARHLTIARYPDEPGRHLEVVNFDPSYGALQLRARAGRLIASDVALFRVSDRSAPLARAVAGANYVLFVVPAGRYDVRAVVREAPGAGPSDIQWLTQLGVPAGATRLTVVVAGPARRPSAGR